MSYYGKRIGQSVSSDVRKLDSRKKSDIFLTGRRSRMKINPSNILADAVPIINANASMIDDNDRNICNGL
jgi:hypothetical protein